MNDILKSAAGVILALAILVVLPAMIRYALWVILPLAVALLFSFGVAIAWRRMFPIKKGPASWEPAGGTGFGS